MSRGLAAAFNTALGEQVIYPAFFFEFDFYPNVGRWWTGETNKSWDGKTWQGALPLGSLELSGEGESIQARRQTFTLNGVDPSFYELVVAQKYRQRSAKTWFALLNSSGAVRYTYLMEESRMDTLSIDEKPEAITLVLNCESSHIDMFTPNTSYLNNNDHHKIYPDDDFYEFVPTLPSKEIPWGLPID